MWGISFLHIKHPDPQIAVLSPLMVIPEGTLRVFWSSSFQTVMCLQILCGNIFKVQILIQ